LNGPWMTSLDNECVGGELGGAFLIFLVPETTIHRNEGRGRPIKRFWPGRAGDAQAARMGKMEVFMDGRFGGEGIAAGLTWNPRGG